MVFGPRALTLRLSDLRSDPVTLSSDPFGVGEKSGIKGVPIVGSQGVLFDYREDLDCKSFTVIGRDSTTMSTPLVEETDVGGGCGDGSS